MGKFLRVLKVAFTACILVLVPYVIIMSVIWFTNDSIVSGTNYNLYKFILFKEPWTLKFNDIILNKYIYYYAIALILCLFIYIFSIFLRVGGRSYKVNGILNQTKNNEEKIAESALIIYNELMLGFSNMNVIYTDNLLNRPISVNKKFLRNKWFNNIAEIKDFLSKKEIILLYQVYTDLQIIDNLLVTRNHELCNRINNIFIRNFEFNSYRDLCFAETDRIEKKLKHEYRNLILKIGNLTYENKELQLSEGKKRSPLNGNGILNYGQNYYKGSIKYGLANGNGKYYEDKRLIYEGIWIDGFLVEGKRYEYYDDGEMWYRSTIKDEKRDENEKVQIKFNKNIIPKGENNYEVVIMKNKYKDGFILELDGNGRIKYEGEIKNYKYNGRGIKYNENGYKEFVGWFEYGEMVNDGEEYYSNGNLKYKGMFKKSLYNGEGIIVHENGKKKLVGSFVNGNINGKGFEYDILGELIYDGDWENGKKHGKGILYKYGSTKLYPLEGTWENNILIDYNQYNENNDLIPGREKVETNMGQAIIVLDEQGKELLIPIDMSKNINVA